jgi:hypothetical protein
MALTLKSEVRSILAQQSNSTTEQQGESMDLVKELKRERGIAESRVKSLAAAIAALGGENSSNHKTGRRKMSAAARRKISLAQKARWRAQKAIA